MVRRWAAAAFPTKCAPSIKISRRAARSPPQSALPPRTAVFIAAAGLIIARAAGCMGRSSGDEGKPLAEEGKAPRERRARANSNTAVQWQMH